MLLPPVRTQCFHPSLKQIPCQSRNPLFRPFPAVRVGTVSSVWDGMRRPDDTPVGRLILHSGSAGNGELITTDYFRGL